MPKKVIITSGYFNPIHAGHINLLKDARALGDFLVVIVNNDHQVKMKGSAQFMSEGERLEIIKSVKHVDAAVISLDRDKSVAKSLQFVVEKFPGNQLFFAKGGDRNSPFLACGAGRAGIQIAFRHRETAPSFLTRYTLQSWISLINCLVILFAFVSFMMLS